ncbi:hypothetical protein [Streptomyces bacillaris]|uniref:hypothetical protein n=1 Tax=Streptomyces bacillaris TaxID=68179 RepID=UPI003D7519C7
MDDDEDLFGLPRPRWSHHEIAILGGADEDDLAIAAGYLEVAELAVRHWIERGPNDGLPIPILYNYRHGIELTLKWLIRLSARCLVRSGYTQENLSPAKLNEKLRTHSIKKLAERLNRYLDLLKLPAPNNRIDDASLALLTWLDSEDETGETFRYALVGHGSNSAPARPSQMNLNFYEQVNEVHKIARLLYAGYSSYLDAFEQDQIEFLSEARQEWEQEWQDWS